MRGYALLLATCLTLAYGYAAQAAMAWDRAGVLRRLAAAAAAHDESTLALPVWNGGTLATITVTATDSATAGEAAVRLARPAGECRQARPSRSRVTAAVRIS